MTIKNTFDEFVEKANTKHNNKYSYEQAEYINSRIQIKITCPIHGVFEQAPKDHVYGRGCPRCNKTFKTTIGVFMEKAGLVHDGQYLYNKVVLKNMTDNVIITCKIHGDFEQQPTSHLSGRGCPCCGEIKRIKSSTLTKDEWVEKALKVHGNKYDYSLVEYIDSKTKVKITCKKHGVFNQQPSMHLTGRGCNACRKKEASEFFEKAKIIHGDRYDYSLVDYKNTTTKVIIICGEHGEFEQSPEYHVDRQQGCSKCAGRVDDKQDFINKAVKIHGGIYNYSLVDYINAGTKVKIICPTHGGFVQTPNSHLCGRGCPRCRGSISKVETLWLDSFNNPNIMRNEKIIKLSSGKKFRPDGLDLTTNTVYEFYGDYWHGNPAVYSPDKLNVSTKKTFGELFNITKEREQAILADGYNLVTIWETEWNQLVLPN